MQTIYELEQDLLAQNIEDKEAMWFGEDLSLGEDVVTPNDPLVDTLIDAIDNFLDSGYTVDNLNGILARNF